MNSNILKLLQLSGIAEEAYSTLEKELEHFAQSIVLECLDIIEANAVNSAFARVEIRKHFLMVT